jgi:hypothetical protein
MGDCDDTYDFTEILSLIGPLDQGFDYVLGSRFGGAIQKGAMSWSHRYIGNPILTGMLNRLFGLGSTDAHSGMRAFTREAYDRMAPRCDGMEFASELVIKAARAELRVTEVPIDYRPRVGETKLKPMQDAWRHVRFMLLLCPQWLFVVPGMVLLLAGLIGQILLLPGWVTIGGHHLESHFSVLFAMICLLGGQALTFGIFGRIHGSIMGLEPDSRIASWFRDRFRLERGLLVGATVILTGLVIDGAILGEWMSRSMGSLNAVGPAMFGMTAIVLGAQILLGSFFLSLLHADVRMHGASSGNLIVDIDALTAPPVTSALTPNRD